MTYLEFHFVFLIPPLLVFLGLCLRYKAFTPRRLIGTAMIVVIALIYTTPWDNYLVYRSIWTYGSDRVLATIGYVPVEEYLFFILQTILVGFIYSFVVRNTTIEKASEIRVATRVIGIVLFLVIAAAGIAMIFVERTMYMGLIVGWAAPVFALQWGFGAELFKKYLGILVKTIAPITVYLWIADATAIRLGIWDITDATKTGIEPFGLPIEEALFFLVTTMFVGQAMLLIESWRSRSYA